MRRCTRGSQSLPPLRLPVGAACAQKNNLKIRVIPNNHSGTVAKFNYVRDGQDLNLRGHCPYDVSHILDFRVRRQSSIMFPGGLKETNINPVGVRGDVLSRLDMFAALDRLRKPRMVTHLLLAKSN